MEENKSGQNQQGNAYPSCSCGKMGMCGCGGHRHGHFALRLILGLAILMLVFWMGVKIGEFKGFFESNYGYGMENHGSMMMRYMMRGGDYNSMGNGAPGMMVPQTNLKTPIK